MMKSAPPAALFLGLLVSSGLSLMGQQMTPGAMPKNPGTPISLDVVENPEACQICRMKRTTFAQSRMLVTYSDGSLGTCSISCMSLELRRKPGRQALELKVADYTDPKRLIDARTAIWVTGGDLRGVMTAMPKWAFEKSADADAFVVKHGGEIASFDQCLALAGQERQQ